MIKITKENWSNFKKSNIGFIDYFKLSREDKIEFESKKVLYLAEKVITIVREDTKIDSYEDYGYTKVKKSKKDYNCELCNELIPAGSSYYYIDNFSSVNNSEWTPYQSRVCLLCERKSVIKNNEENSLYATLIFEVVYDSEEEFYFLNPVYVK